MSSNGSRRMCAMIAVARVVDLVEERAARRHVVDRARQRVHVRAHVELDRVEHLLGGDVARRAGDEAPADLGGTLMERTIPKSMTTAASGGVTRGVPVLSRVELLAARERQAEPHVGGLDVAVDEARRCAAPASPAHDFEDDLPQLERASSASPSRTASGRRRSGTRGRGTARPPETPRSMMFATFGWYRPARTRSPPRRTTSGSPRARCRSRSRAPRPSGS